MRLVYVVKRFPKVSETFVLNEVLELLAQGEDVRVCSLLRPHPGDPMHPGTETVLPKIVYVPDGARRFVSLLGRSLRVLTSRPLRAVPALWLCARWAARDRAGHHLKRFGEAAWLLGRIPPDADHFHAHFAHGATTVALLLARLTGKPFSFTGHARDIFQLVPPAILSEKESEARFVVAVSEHTRQHLAGIVARSDREKIVVVRNGIDTARFVPRAREPDGVPLLLDVSRLVEKKGVETLVEACGILAARGLSFCCDVIGDGPRREALEARARALHVDDRMRLLGGLGHDEVRSAYRRAAVFALPCQTTRKGDRDGLPVALVEAMAVGVPVVTTPVSGIPEVVRDGQSGLLVPPEDPAALAAAIERLLGDPDLRARVVAGGHRAVAAFDSKATVGRLRTLFRNGPEAA